MHKKHHGTIAISAMPLIALTLVSLVASSCQKNSAPPSDQTSALALFKTAVKYQQSGRIELSRKTLEKVIEMDPNGKVGNTAKVHLLTKLPRYQVTSEAEQRNIIGFNQMNHGDMSAARKTFSALIHDFPKFEYPYGNLAYLYIQERELKEAKTLLQQVLQINPNYLNGWKYSAEIQRIEKDDSGYSESIRHIRALRLGQELDSEADNPRLD